jgi:tetratricopeptide (TPR) repeat protein
VGVVRPLRASAACRRGDVLLIPAPARALPYLQEAVALDPTRDVCAARLGTAALLLARATADGAERRRLLELSREALEGALARVPAEAYHHANLGRLLTERVRDGLSTPAEALLAFEMALARDPHNGHVLAEAALAALTLGDPARARGYATRATTLYPDFGPPRAVLGFLALSAGEDGAAVELLAEALRGQWRGDERSRQVATANLAAALLRLGRHQEALAPAQEAVDLAPEDPDTRFNLARTLELLGRREEARREYQNLLARHPQHAYGRQALQALESAEALAPSP